MRGGDDGIKSSDMSALMKEVENPSIDIVWKWDMGKF